MILLFQAATGPELHAGAMFSDLELSEREQQPEREALSKVCTHD